MTRPPVYVLGLSAHYHDAAAALLADGAVIAAAQEERFTRHKGDPRIPVHAVGYCLAEAGIRIDDVAHVAFYEKPWVHFERILDTATSVAPAGFALFQRAMPPWISEKLLARSSLRRALRFRGSVLFVDHHESHFGAAFYPSPFEQAAILTVDGTGEWATAAWGWGDRGELHRDGELRFPHSLGLLYAAFTAHLGFEVNEGEYKVMGLAPYGEPTLVQTLLDEIVDLRPDGSLRLNLDYFDYLRRASMTNDRFSRLVGAPPRAPESPLLQIHLDLARSIQAITEEAMLRMARHVHARTGQDRLVLAGGVALNSVANGRLARESPFREIWIQPAAGDAGSAVGAAKVAWHRYLGQERVVSGRGDGLRGGHLGPEFSTVATRAQLDRVNAVYRELGDPELFGVTAAHLDAGDVVGWFDGRMEYGPRALGARSILADARSPTMRHVLNEKIKQREAFRPFAPAVLAHRSEEWFQHAGPSPYMLFVAQVHEDHQKGADRARALRGLEKLDVLRSDIPAVTHVDGSARLQTVDGEYLPRFRGLLEAFEARTGCPVIVNTSFNVRGEPIVCTPHDAYRCFMRTDMDVLVLGSLFLSKGEQPPWSEAPPPASPWAPPEDLRSPRAMGFSFGTVFVAAACFGLWEATATLSPGRVALLAVGLALFGVAVIAPAVLRGANRALTRVLTPFGTVTTGVLLTVVFVLLIVPIALVRRALRDDSLGRTARESYWQQPAEDLRGRERYEMQF